MVPIPNNEIESPLVVAIDMGELSDNETKRRQIM